MKKLLFVLILLIVLPGCSSESNPPDELIDEQTYEQIFMEFAIINQLDKRILEDRSQEELRQLVLQFQNRL